MLKSSSTRGPELPKILGITKAAFKAPAPGWLEMGWDGLQGKGADFDLGHPFIRYTQDVQHPPAPHLSHAQMCKPKHTHHKAQSGESSRNYTLGSCCLKKKTTQTCLRCHRRHPVR